MAFPQRRPVGAHGSPYGQPLTTTKNSTDDVRLKLSLFDKSRLDRTHTLIAPLEEILQRIRFFDLEDNVPLIFSRVTLPRLL